MKAVIQRVTYAGVTVEGKVTGKIDKGLMILVGVAPTDTIDVLYTIAEKCAGLRIFKDENGKMNLSVTDIGGRVLAISQFTLYADCKKGKRPSFTDAASGEFANDMYLKFVKILEEIIKDKVETGIFGADMKVELLNDGPVTIILDSDNLNIKKYNMEVK